MAYTPLRTYLESLTQYFLQNHMQKPPGYRRRSAERNLIA
jgi:hypothetical protein